MLTNLRFSAIYAIKTSCFCCVYCAMFHNFVAENIVVYGVNPVIVWFLNSY